MRDELLNRLTLLFVDGMTLLHISSQQRSKTKLREHVCDDDDHR